MLHKKIKSHYENKTYCKITRSVGKVDLLIHGYIIGYSDDFILLHENDDFVFNGYSVLPIDQIKKIRFNNYDKYFHQIITWEGLIDKIGINYAVDLTNWTSVFNSIKAQKLNVIVECEDPYFDSFTIGPIIKASTKRISIQNFDPSGYLDEKPTKILFENISRVCFDDNYANVFSKYLRHRKAKTKAK